MSNDIPVLRGIGRDKDDARSIVLYLDREATDNVIQDIHAVLTTNKPVVGYQVRSNRKSMPDHEDDWSEWRYVENVDTWKNRADRMPDAVQIRALIVKD